MAVSKERKAQAHQEIFDLLEKYGKTYDFGPTYKNYADEVPRSTFYRWVRAIEATGAPIQKAMRKAKKRVKTKSKKHNTTDKKELSKIIAKEAIEVMPIVPDAKTIIGVSLEEMNLKLADCIREMDAVIGHSKTADGKIKNPRLLVQGVEVMRRIIDSSNKLIASSWERKRMQQYLDILFSLLEEVDPVVATEFVARLKQKNIDMGVMG